MSDVAAFRIFKANHAGTAMSGEGVKKFGGRWNSPGVAVVYCSSFLALAQLEVLVHLSGITPPATYQFIALTTPADCGIRTITASELGQLPFDWKSHPPHMGLQAIGDDWIAKAEFLALRVPSVVSPHEFNILLNPKHPDFAKVIVQAPARLEWDERLFLRGAT